MSKNTAAGKVITPEVFHRIAEDFCNDIRIRMAKVLELDDQRQHIREEIEELRSSLRVFRRKYANSVSASVVPVELEQFAGMNLAEAAKAVLILHRGELANAELWKAMEEGGATTSSQNPVNNLNAILSEKPQIFRRGPENGWDLVGSIRADPNSIREAQGYSP